MNRESTFAHLGIDISHANNIQVALADADLDYIVEKKPIFYPGLNDNMTQMEDFVTPMRLTDGYSYGVVSKDYGVLQNSDAFAFIDYINAPIEFVKGGETKGGMIYIIAKMEEMDVLGDKFIPYILFRNSFNGKYALSACISPLRIVCQNQFTMAFKNANNTINLKHTSKIEDRYQEASKVLGKTANYLAEFKKQAENYAGIHLSQTQRSQIIRELFPINDDMTDRQKRTVTDAIMEYERAYNHDDNMNFRGSAWGMLNALSDVYTHKEVKNTANGAENKFVKVTFDDKIMQKMMSLISSIA